MYLKLTVLKSGQFGRLHSNQTRSKCEYTFCLSKSTHSAQDTSFTLSIQVWLLHPCFFLLQQTHILNAEKHEKWGETQKLCEHWDNLSWSVKYLLFFKKRLSR